MADAIDDAQLAAFGEELMRFNRRKALLPAGSELDLSAFRILRLLVEHGPQTMRAIADDLDLEQSTVSRQTAATVKAGLTERAAGESGQQLVATVRGAELYRHDLGLRVAQYRRALGALGPDQVDRLTAALKAFSDALDDQP